MNDESRFFAKVMQSGECWLWTGALNERGYGEFSVRSRRVKAHRWVYELMIATVPVGLHLDHLCRNRACVNPWHLEPVTPRVNYLRGVGTSAANARKTHCIRGHAFDAENTRWINGGHRQCIACKRDQRRRERERGAA